jgi:hypothetical protein
MQCRSRPPQRNATDNFPAIWGSTMAAGATWLSVASAPSNASNGCC